MKPKPPRKLCPSCQRRRPPEAFALKAHRVDGRKCWCVDCIAAIGRASPLAKARLRRRYRADRSRAYQLWYRISRGQVVFDKRVAHRDGRVYRMRWSRTSEHVVVECAWPEWEKARNFLVRYFDAEPADLRDTGRGGGSGARRQATCYVEGGLDEKRWQAGLKALVVQGWIVARTTHSDVAAEGS